MNMKVNKACVIIITGFPGGSDCKESACNAGATGDVGSIPGSERTSGGRNGNLLQYSYLGNPMDKGDWATINEYIHIWNK